MNAPKEEAKKEEEKIDLFEDPEGRLGQMQKQMQEQMMIQRIQMSEYMAKQQHEDYDEKLERFTKESSKEPCN